MDVAQLDLVIQKLRKLKKCINLQVLKNFSEEAYSFVLEQTSFLPPESKLKERLFCIANNIHERQLCPTCKEHYLKFLKSGRYQDGCCQRCTLATDAHKKRMLEKYGFESPNSSPVVKQHKVEALLSSYGVTNSYQIPSVREHAKQKSLEEHGVEHWTNIEQSMQTYFEKTGYRNPSQDPEVKAKKSLTCMSSLSVCNPSQSEEIKQQKVETCLSNFGVEYGFMLNKHVVYKAISSLNERMYKILDEAGIAYEKEFRIFANGTYRSYDIAIKESKLIVELNGDFWHANPKRFKADDVLNFPHIGEVKACDIWKRDYEKRKLAEDLGYEVLYFWESDFKKMSDQELLDIVKAHL